MNKNTSNQNKRRWVAAVLLLLSTFGTLPVKAQGPEQNRWLNWVDYVCHHPDYRQHQEPQEIATKGALWGTWVTFPNKIAAIAAKVRNWEDPTALFKSLDFVAMYKHPRHYYDHCLEYLADPKQPEQHKQIVIYALEQFGHLLAFDCYKLYQQQKINEELFRLALGEFELLRIHPLVVNDIRPGPFKWIACYPEENKKFLRQVQTEVGAQTPIGLQAEAILSGQLAKKWGTKGPSPLLHYCDKLPIAPTIRQATKEYLKYVEDRQWMGGWKELSGAALAALRGQQQFLMLLEHVNEYIFLSDEDYNDSLFSFLKDPHTTNYEKQVFLFAMYRLDGMHESRNTEQTISRGVACLLDRTYRYYRTGQLALPLLEELLYSSVPLARWKAQYPSYPFYVTWYKSLHVQEQLDRFIALPTVPSGWKELAKQLKKGTLLTKQEMNYLKGYQEFLGTHFILYDTILPQK